MLTYILDGGPIMWPLMLLSIVVLAVIIDRWRAFVHAMQDTDRVRKEVSHSLEKDDLPGAIEACQQATGPLAAVTLAGLDKYRRMLLKGRSVLEMETVVAKLLEDYAPRALAGLEKRLNILMLIAGVAPLLGMTGTVTGMIKSFDKMAEMAGLDPSGVAGGISEALLTTAAGLIIAIPALVAYNLFARRVDSFILTIEEMMSDVLGHISERV
jgi:biopolymer transport protein ExbB